MKNMANLNSSNDMELDMGSTPIPSTSNTALQFSCTLSHIQYGFFLPMFMLPYFFRCFRLLQVFRAHNRHFVLKKKKGVFAFKRVKSLYCVRETNLIKWLIIVLIPFLVLTLVALFDVDFRTYFPSFEVFDCLRTDTSETLSDLRDTY